MEKRYKNNGGNSLAEFAEPDRWDYRLRPTTTSEDTATGASVKRSTLPSLAHWLQNSFQREITGKH
jgi:hypothetical protein